MRKVCMMQAGGRSFGRSILGSGISCVCADEITQAEPAPPSFLPSSSSSSEICRLAFPIHFTLFPCSPPPSPLSPSPPLPSSHNMHTRFGAYFSLTKCVKLMPAAARGTRRGGGIHATSCREICTVARKKVGYIFELNSVSGLSERMNPILTQPGTCNFESEPAQSRDLSQPYPQSRPRSRTQSSARARSLSLTHPPPWKKEIW